MIVLFKRKTFYVITITCLLLLVVFPTESRLQPEAGFNHYRQKIYTLNDENIMGEVWSPDGSQVAYVSCPDGQAWSCDLKVADWNLKNAKVIYTGIAYYGLMDWQGDWLLIMPLLQEGYPTSYYGQNELFKIRSDGTDLTQLTFSQCPTTGWVYDYRGRVSWGKFLPGKDQIYFSMHDCNGWYQPYVASDDGNFQLQSLGPGYSFTIGMSRSGNTLTWGDASYWNNPTSLYASTWNEDHFTSGTLLQSFPIRVWSLPLVDESTIILSWSNGDIRAINADGSDFRVVIEDGYTNNFEDSHPIDGQAFTMRSNRAEDGNTHIFKVNSDGSGIIQLTDGNYNDIDSKYSPNGQYIMYRRLPVGEDPLPYPDSTPYQLVVKNVIVTEITNLINSVNSYVDSGVLTKWQGKYLTKILEKARQTYDLSQFLSYWTPHDWKNMRHYSFGKSHFSKHFDNNYYINQMFNQFIYKVNWYVKKGMLSTEQGQTLIRPSNAIKLVLNA